MYSVTIYPSEYGKKQMVVSCAVAHVQANEEKYGPEGRIVQDTEDFIDDENAEETEKINEDRRLCALSPL